MSKRSVEVELVLKTAQYKTEARSAKDSTEALDRSVEATDRDLKKLPPDAAKAAAAMKLLGAESATANLKLEDGTGKSSTAMGKLEQDLVKARGEAHKFAEEFNRTGSSSSLANMFKSQDTVNELEKFKSRLVEALGSAGQTGGQEFTKNLSAEAQSFESNPISGPVIGLAIANAIVAASPFIGAALNGVLLSAIGLGGIGLGIVGQLHDPAVVAAATGAGHSLMAALGADTAPFKDPLIQAIGSVEGAISHLLDTIHFDKLAAAVGPIERGIEGLFDHMGPGLSKAFDAAVPVLVALGDALPGLGDALSEFFASLAAGSEGGAEGLRTLFLILDKTIIGIGNLIEFTSRLYDGFVKSGAQMNQWAQDLVGGVPIVGTYVNKIGDLFDKITGGTPGVKVLGHTLGDLSGNASAVTDALRKMSDEFDKAFGKTMSLDEANLQYKTDLLALKDAVGQHGASLDANSKSGQENRRMLLGLIQDAENTRKAMIDQAGGANASQAAIDAANQQYQDTIGSLDTFAAKLGISKTELDKITGNYDINLLFTTTYRTVGTPPRDLSYGNIPTGRIGGQRWGGVYEHAQDGALRDAGLYSPMSPARYAFAEPATGGEAFIPKYGDARRSTGILAHAAGWYGMDVVPRGMAYSRGGATSVAVNVSVSSGGGDEERYLAAVVQRGIRTGKIRIAASAIQN